MEYLKLECGCIEKLKIKKGQYVVTRIFSCQSHADTFVPYNLVVPHFHLYGAIVITKLQATIEKLKG